MSLNTFTIYLFGGTGDLSKRKLLPAIFRQETLSSIDHESQIIGIGSKDMSLDEYVSMVKESLSNHFNGFDPSGEAWTRFSMRLGYKKLDINSDSDWEKFGENMFTSETPDAKIYALKPMNCPGPVSYTHSEPTRQAEISYAVFCLKKKTTTTSPTPTSSL